MQSRGAVAGSLRVVLQTLHDMCRCPYPHLPARPCWHNQSTWARALQQGRTSPATGPQDSSLLSAAAAASCTFYNE